MSEIRTVVIKVGTTTITEKSGRINRRRALSLVSQMAQGRQQGVDLALVSSGAISAGVERLGLRARPTDVQELQAVAAVGQGLLVQMYTELFWRSRIPVGQVLLTQSDLTHRKQYLNARHTLAHLFAEGVVPIINENDTVATEEITFGDNDLLGALVAAAVKADLLVMLTDTAGLHTADPGTTGDAELLRRVEAVTPEIELLAGETRGVHGSGGMFSKVQAAKVAVSSGVPVIIADGNRRAVISEILSDKRPGTYFPAGGRVASKKHWIGFAKMSAGALVVDAGAATALRERGKSLLAAGVVDVRGEFRVGDAVDILDESGNLIGRGLTNYASGEAAGIKGMRSQQAREVLGEKAEPVVHRDDLLVFR